MSRIIKTDNAYTIENNGNVKTVTREEVGELINSASDIQNCINMLMYQLNIDELTAGNLLSSDIEDMNY